MILLAQVLVFSGHARQDAFPVLKGFCLGQKPPGSRLEIFAPQVITEATHSGAVFSPGGREVYWVPWSTLRMRTMKQAVVTRDGKYLFFVRMRSGKPQIYWTDAGIIEESKPKTWRLR